MLYELLLEPKLQKLTPVGLTALELAVALGRLWLCQDTSAKFSSQPTNQRTPILCQIVLHT